MITVKRNITSLCIFEKQERLSKYYIKNLESISKSLCEEWGKIFPGPYMEIKIFKFDFNLLLGVQKFPVKNCFPICIQN